MADSSRPVDPGHFFAKVLADQHYQKGREAEQQGDWERALLSYRRACEIDGHNVLFMLARGHVCQAHGLEREAEECYRLALQLRPDDPVALYNQAQLLATRGEVVAARANLARIVAGDVESLGARAAPVFCRLGDIALRGEDYVSAGLHFRRALECAPEHRYAAAALEGLERFAEFERPFGADGRLLPKLAVYGYGGAMLLGFPDDDGIAIPAYPPLGFDSLDEVAQTLARFTALARAQAWSFNWVVPLDAEARPLAVALAVAGSARCAAAPEHVPSGASALAVTAMGADRQALADGLAILRERAGRSLCYAVGLAVPVWEYGDLVQVASLPVRLEFPWNRREAAAVEHAEAFGAELAARLASARAPDTTAAAQAGWYAAHSRLNFDPHTLQLRSPGPDATRSPARWMVPRRGLTPPGYVYEGR
jgi:hypothetical protein